MRGIRGITLIALIITIIILLILAGISINLVLGENSILTRVKQAKEDYSQSDAKEKLELILLNFQTKKINNEIYQEEELNKVLQENNIEVKENLVTVNGWQFEIDRSVPKIVKDLEKIQEEDKLKPIVVDEEIVSEEDKIQISIKIKNEEGTKITYFITDIETGLEVGRIENSTKLSHTFSNLKEGKKYEITVQTVNENGISTKKIPVATLINYVPILTEKNSQIIGSPKFLETGSWSYEIYKPEYAFDRNESTSACSNINGNASIGSYIGYNFLKPVKICKVVGKIRMLGYKIQYSDDLENWIDVAEGKLNSSGSGDYFSNNINKEVGTHQYWRLYVNGGQLNSDWAAMVYSLKFYGENKNN